VIVLFARYNGKNSKSVMDYIMEKIFDAKLDPDIESPSHETHFDTLPSTCLFGGGLGKIFALSCVRKRLFESELL